MGLDGSADADRHIVLVGMMGAGKSSVGRIVAERLGRLLLDSDDLVEERLGRSIREFWADEGEVAFRSIEHDVLAEALDSDEPAVIAAAGGVVLSEANRSLLVDDRSHVVWLLAEVDLLLQRVRNGMHRPLLDDDPEGTLRAMHATREPLYREVADAIVSVDNRSVHDVVGAVIRCSR